jgi:hypothetical protein
MHYLESLDIGSNHIEDMGALSIIKAFMIDRDLDCKLQRLVLSDNQIGKSLKFKDFVIELSLLIEKDCLTHLDLSWNNLKGEQAKILGSKIKGLE